MSSTRQATIAIADMEARLIDLDAQIEGGVAARRNMSTLDAVKSIYHASLRIDSTQRLLEAKAVEMRDQVASSLTILEAYKDFAQVLRQIGLGLETEMKGMKASDRDGVERAQRELERGDGAQVFTQHGFAEPALSWNAQDLLDNFDVVTAEDMDPKRILN